MSRQPPPASDGPLTTGWLRAMLDACGYHSTVVMLGGRHCLPAGGRLSLQFCDEFATTPDGATSATMRCSLTLNGDDGLDDHVSRWAITKAIDLATDRGIVRLKIEADLLLASRVQLADLVRYGGAVQGHVRLLVADARTMLDEVRQARHASAMLRIDARYVGDLTLGRVGLVKSAVRETLDNAQPRADINRAACDWLGNVELPRLAREMARMMVAVKLASASPFAAPSHPRPRAERIADTDNPPVPVPVALH